MIRSGTYQGHPHRIAVAITILIIELLAGVASAEIIQVNISIDKKDIVLNSNPDITVTILSTDSFNATMINIPSVRFESAPVENTGNGSVYVKNGTHIDLSLKFKLQNTVIQCEYNQRVYLIGKTNNGRDIVGSAAIEIKDCNPSPPSPPKITSFAPSSPVMNNVSEPRTFNISVNQTVDVVWFINGTPVQVNISEIESKYTNTNASLGIWNVTARANNANGTDIQSWDWIVGKVGTSTSITSSQNTSEFGQSVTFTALVNVVAPGAGTPTGTVTFKDGAATLGTGALSSGQATFSTSNLSNGSHSITAEYGGDDNFSTSTSPALTQTVNKAPAMITLSNLTQTYDGTSKVATASTDPSGLTGVYIIYDGISTAPTNAGNYTVVATLTNANYEALDVTGTLVINKANQIITFDILSNKIYGDISFDVNATASSGLPVSFTASGACTVSDSTVTITEAGICTITAHQAGDSNYNAASDVPQTFSINKEDQIIAFGALSDKTYGDSSFIVSATTSSGLIVSFTASGTCTVSDSIVTIIGAGNCTITASQAGDDNYNPAPDVSQTFIIAKASQIIDWSNPADITYGTALGATQLNASVTVIGPAPAGALTYLPASGTVLNAGTEQTLSVTAAATDNYNEATTIVHINVMKADQTITFGALSDKTYGDADFTVNAMASSELPVSFTAAGACTVTESIITIMGTGICTITAHQAGDSNYNAAPDVSQALNINKATATIILKDLVHTYDGTPKSVIATTNPGELTGVSITYDSLSTAPIDAGSYTVVATLTNDNYSASEATGTLVINKADTLIAITSSQNPSVFGQVVTFTTTVGMVAPGAGMPTGTVTFKDGAETLGTGTLSSGQATFSTSTLSNGSHSIAVEYGGDTNFNISTGTLIQTVNKATATITLSDLTQTYDGTPKSATATTNPAGLTGVSITYDGSSMAPTNAGSYAIVATLTNANYEALDVTGTFVINKTNQIITFGTLSDKIYRNPPFTISATASSGLIVNFTASGTCVISDSIVTITGAGNCTITAHQTGNSNYNVAPDVPQTFSINKAIATITLSGLTQMYDGTPKSATATTNPAGLTGVSITYNGSSIAPMDVGSYAVVATMANDNYQATPASGTLIIKKVDQTITISSSAGASTGGSGCGRNVYSKENFSNIKKYEYSREVDVHISKGTIVFNFTTLSILNEVGFTAKTNEGCTVARGELLKGRTSQATSDAPGVGTIYFNAWVGPRGYSESSKIENQYIVFSVPNRENNESVKLMMYKDSSWIDLKTEKIGIDTYKAYTNGFGSFAIVAISETPSETLSQPVATSLAITNEPISDKPVNLSLIIILLVAIAILIVIYRWYRKGLSRKK